MSKYLQALLYCTLSLFVTSCLESGEPGQYDYLLGKWKRTNDKEGVQTYENWIRAKNGDYKGLGFTMQGRDTSWRENILIHEQAGEWYFTVQQKGELGETPFLITDSDQNSFSCENEENEFPKKIVYQVSSDSIYAVISGGEYEMDFIFVRIRH